MVNRHGKVITFYSFKGGVGRSMALANVACLLARRTDVNRVLAVDWDLDAPGLHHYFATSNGSGSLEQSATQLGLIDLFTELSEKTKQVSSDFLSDEEQRALIEAIEWDRFVVPTAFPSVEFLSAGKLDPAYSRRVAELDWRGLFRRAPELIRAFAERLAQTYDYVFVDSRTGFSDVSGICTALLPENLVFVFTPNHQSIDGGIDVLRRATTYRRESGDLRPLAIFPLQSRLEMSEPELFASWRFGSSENRRVHEGYQERFESLFREVYGLAECDLKRYFDEVQIQHVPRYSYGEELAVVTEPAQGTRLSLSRSYAAFANVLAGPDEPWSIKPQSESGTELLAGAKPTFVKLTAAKEYITDERFRLKLHDLVADEVRAVLPEISRIPYQGRWTREQFAERLHSYEAICNDLVHLETLLAFWGERSHENILTLGPKRIAAQVRPESGLTVWLAMRWYPTMLLTYAAGIASVTASKYNNLLALFSIRVPDNSEERDLVSAMGRAAAELHDAFKNLPDYERHYTPRSDYLFKLLEPVLDTVVFTGSDYENAFDRFELIFALEYVHRSETLLGSVWGPPGRFAWKFRGNQNPFGQLLDEAKGQGPNWAPLKAGFFSGSQDRFESIAAKYRETISRFGFY
jgi:Mrp family chromosome partitioning ATPase